MTALRFAGVSRSFGATAALREVNFELPRGIIVGLIGDNGAGKSTLIRLSAGVMPPSSGEVFVLGRSATRNDPWLMTRLGALIETPGHYDELSVEENLRFAYSCYNGVANRGMLDDILRTTLTQFGLTDVARAKAGRLSSGFRQRIAIARALHPWAEVALLDEPFMSLDPDVRSDIKHSLRHRAAAGTLVLFSSHTLTDVERIADEILVLIMGRLYRFRDFAEIRARVDAEPGEDTDIVYARLKKFLAVTQES